MEKSIKQKIILSELEKNPTIPANTLARKLMKENPGVWNKIGSCTRNVRYYLGTAGKEKMKYLLNKKFVREKRKSGDIFGEIPKGKTDFDKWDAVKINVEKALIIGDVHVPYHNKEALEISLQKGLDEGCKDVIINGDFMDFYAVSKWEKDPRKRNFPSELKTGYKILHAIRELFPDGKVIYKIGNHEERYERYMRSQAPVLLGVDEFEFENLMHLSDYGIDLVTDMKPLKASHLFILHGHEYRFSISNPVNPARGLYLRAKECALTHHFHQTSEHSESSLSGRQVSTWSVGCLCDMHPEYMPLNKWGLGFAILDMTTDDSFQLDNYKIIKGKVY